MTVRSDEQIAKDFFETTSYVGPVEDWENLPELGDDIDDLQELKDLGGAGSGNFGHAGRPGEVGGSGEGGSVEESRGAPKLEVIQRVHELKAQGWSDSRIGREVFNQRGPGRTREILDHFNRDGTLKEGKSWPPSAGPKPEGPIAPPERPIAPPEVEPPIVEAPPPSGPSGPTGDTQGATAWTAPTYSDSPRQSGSENKLFGPVRPGTNRVTTTIEYGRSGASLTSAQAFAARNSVAEVDRVLTEYPGATARIYDMSFQQGRTLSTEGGHENAMGLWYGSAQRMVVATGESGDIYSRHASEWNAVRGAQGVARHELGHAVWDNAPSKLRIGFSSLARSQGSGGKSSGLYRRDRFNRVESAQMRSGIERLAKGVSVYSKTNLKELWAESFGMYTHKDYDSGGVRQLPKEIHDFMVEHIGRPVRNAS